MDTPIVDAKINERKEQIYKLGQDLEREARRLAHSDERVVSAVYTTTNNALKDAKKEYEEIVGRPYSPPNPKPSQFDSTLFIRPRTRTSSAESQLKEEETASAKLS